MNKINERESETSNVRNRCKERVWVGEHGQTAPPKQARQTEKTRKKNIKKKNEYRSLNSHRIIVPVQGRLIFA